MNSVKEQRRFQIGLGLFFAVLLLFIGQLVYLQVVKGEEYFAQSVRKIAKVETVEAARGQIQDRNGLPLASNRVSWQLSLDLYQMKEQRVETLKALTNLCRKDGVPWADSLPVTREAPYLFIKDVGEGAWGRYERYLESIKLPQPDKAQALLDALASHYDLPSDLSPQLRRSLVGILYEVDLRAKNLTWTKYVFASDVSMDFMTRIKEQSLPGVTITPTAQRAYLTPAAAHILGRVGLMNEEEWARYKAQGYGMDEHVGKDGLEQAFETYLHGEKGQRLQEVDTEGTVVSESYSKIPVPGKNVRLTIDLGLQEKTEQVLAEEIPKLPHAEGAAVAILDVRNGGVLTMASYPSFDLSQFSENFGAISADPLRPLYNRALQGTYAPGSTFKMVTAVAGLEEGIITPKTKILDTGRYTYYRNPQPYCWIYRQTGKTHGLETVAEAITDSCNIFFYDVGRRVGIERLDKYARRFGLGALTGIELAGEAPGVIAGPAYTQSLGQTWYDGNTLSAAIGQENNRFTPLQLASYVATIANGGQRYQVHLLKEVLSNDGKSTVFTQTPKLLDTVTITPKNLKAVKEGMLAVTESGSVAGNFRKLPIQVAAKTGSAQVTGNEEANAVFVCFAPYENPEVAMAIVVEKGGSGSELGRIAAQILEHYFAGREAFQAEGDIPAQGEPQEEVSFEEVEPTPRDFIYGEAQAEIN